MDYQNGLPGALGISEARADELVKMVAKEIHNMDRMKTSDTLKFFNDELCGVELLFVVFSYGKLAGSLSGSSLFRPEPRLAEMTSMLDLLERLQKVTGGK